jgi:hypothetical protein
VHVHGGAVRNVAQVWRQTAQGNRVEIVVVAVNPVDRRAERRVVAVFGGDVTNAEPAPDLGMRRDDAAGVGKGAVDVA